MCAAIARGAAASFASDAEVHCGDHSVAVDAALGQELLVEIGKIGGLHLSEEIQAIVISPCALGEKNPDVHRIKIHTKSGITHLVQFKKREGARGGSKSYSIRGYDHGEIPEVTAECPEAKAYHLAERMVGLELFELGKAHLMETRDKYSLSNVKLGPTDLGKVNEVSEKWIIPLSDIFAILRNGLGLVMIILILTGMGPLAPTVLALGIAFSICLILQGTLFAFPQGTFAWGADGASKFMVVRSLSDVQHKRGMALKAICGFLSLVEGLLWIALGLSGIVPAMAGAAGILTFILFNVFFTCSFVLMTGMGIADYRRHVKFRDEIVKHLVNPADRVQRHGFFRAVRTFLGIDAVELSFKEGYNLWTKDQCLGVLKYLRSQAMEGVGRDGSETKDDLIKEAARRIYRLEEQTDAAVVTELDYIDQLIAQVQAGDALVQARDLVNAALKANEINLTYDIWTVRFGVIGTIVGGVIYNILHILGLETIGMAADFFAWMPLNAGFLLLDVSWIVPSLVEGDFKATAKEKLFDPVKGWFQSKPVPSNKIYTV